MKEEEHYAKVLGWSVSRSILGVTINGSEWLLNDDGSTMLFPTKWEAECYLAQHGVRDEDIKKFKYTLEIEEDDNEECNCG